MRYMVMETQLAYAVVLDEAGRFVKVANLRYEPGDVLENVFPMVDELDTTVVLQKDRKEIKPETRGRSFIRYRHMAAAAAAACLIFGTGLAYSTFFVTYGSVYMSINPELRIDVNSRDKVIGIEALDDDGKELSAGYGYRNKSFDEAVEELGERAISMGYLEAGGRIDLRISSDRDGWTEAHGEKLAEELAGYTDKGIYVSIELTDNSGTGELIELVPESEPETETLKIQEKDETWSISIPDQEIQAAVGFDETEPSVTVPFTETETVYEMIETAPVPEAILPPETAPARTSQAVQEAFGDASDYGSSDSGYGDSGYLGDGDSSYGGADSGYDD